MPTTGNIPNNSGGLVSIFLACFGPMARRVEDLELMLSVIAGPDGIDPFCAPVPLHSSHEVDVKKLRIKYFLDNGVSTPDNDTIKQLENGIEKLRSHVANITRVNPPAILQQTLKLVWDTCFLGGDGGKLLLESLAKIGQTEFSPLYQQFLQYAKGSSFDNTELRRRLEEIFIYKQEMLKLMADADVLICPVHTTPAKKHGTTFDHVKDFSYAMTFNLTGWPAASINCGFSSSGLPIGMQIAAKSWQDHVVLALAKKAQELFGIPPLPTM